jgi:hypothetical protein
MTLVEVVVRSLVSFWTKGRPIERVAYRIGALLTISGVVHGLVLLIGGGSWTGPLSLRKPTTFGLSFGTTLINVTWVSSFLRLSDRARGLLLSAFSAACVAETALVSIQAWRGVPSHFNFETTLDGLVSRSLAAGGVVLVAVVVGMTATAFRSQPQLPPSVLLSIRIGLVVLVAAQVIGALMIATGVRLVFAGQPQVAYATGGFLKPAHAVTMHAILVLPLLSWLLSFADCAERQRVRIVWLAACVYLTLAAATLLESVFDRQPGL